MMFGQRYKGRGRVSNLANYVQLEITGLNATDIIRTYFELQINKPVILFLDNIQKREESAFADDILKAEKIYDVKDAIVSLQAFGADVIGLTLTPVSRKGLLTLASSWNRKIAYEERISDSISKSINFDDWIKKLNDIYDIPVLAKNTSNKDLFLSHPEEIIEFSKNNKITLDSVDLINILENSDEKYLEFIHKVNQNNIQEIHVKDVEFCRKVKNHLNIETYQVNYDHHYENLIKDLVEHISNIPWATLLLHGTGGSAKDFEENVKLIQDVIR